MLAYTIRRIVLIIPLLLAVATITFFLMHAVEGGPFDGDRPLSPTIRASLERRYGLDQPIYTQYRKYITNLVQLDLGISFTNDREVTDILREKVPISAQVGISAFIYAALVGITLGVFSALNQNGPLDYLGVFVATAGAALPSFVLAPLLQIAFAIKLGWFNVLGWELFNYKQMILPTVALGTLPAAFVARITRASMLDILRQDYIRTARAKGVQELAVIIRHAVRNALIPVLTVLGPIFAGLITGSFIIERAFQIPGIGRQFVDSVLVRDYGLIMGTTLFFAVVIAIMNLVVDLLYAVVDPRIRY
jgi:oligopeptide transport system permease protein